MWDDWKWKNLLKKKKKHKEKRNNDIKDFENNLVDQIAEQKKVKNKKKVRKRKLKITVMKCIRKVKCVVIVQII